MSRTTRRRLAIQDLEARVLMHGGHGEIDPATVESASCDGAQDDVPALHSLPGAAAKIFLDFDGHYEDKWGSREHIDIVGFNLEGTCSSFSQRELDVINDVWKAVAEDFAPFNINVTTVEPGSFEDGEALRVVIGGHAWENSSLGTTTSGVAKYDSFTNPDISNVAFTFSKNIEERGGYGDDEGLAAMIGTTVSHEAGHSFGLKHQSAFDADGNETAEYNSGTGTWTPIMGMNRSTDRTTWHDGATTSDTTLQDDMSILANDTNGFGYRYDAIDGDIAGAATLTSTFFDDGKLKASSVIETTADVDMYRFETDGGETTIDLDVLEFANLDARLQLISNVNGSYQVIATSDPANALDASITADLAAGEYFISVDSHGTYGDVGYYRVTVDLGDNGSGDLTPQDWANDLRGATDLLYQRGPRELRRPGPRPDPVPYMRTTKDVMPAPVAKETIKERTAIAAPTRATVSMKHDRAVDQVMAELGGPPSKDLKPSGPRVAKR